MATDSATTHKAAAHCQNPIVFTSPKRKRDADDGQGREESPMRLRTELPSRPLVESYGDSAHSVSPRTKVSDQLRTMKLDMDFSIPILDFGKPTDSIKSTNAAALSRSGDSASGPNPTSNSQTAPSAAAPAQPLLTPIATENIALPTTPTLEPTKSPQSAPQVISPLPIPSPPPRHGSTLASPTPKSKEKAIRPTRIKSPPPTSSSSAVSDLVWTADEITGHDPRDPADDGYGINGIGFRPTPAIAQVRAQKRRQQVAEWRSREAKEARQRRFERRKGLGQSLDDGFGSTEQAPRRVRFVEG